MLVVVECHKTNVNDGFYYITQIASLQIQVIIARLSQFFNQLLAKLKLILRVRQVELALLEIFPQGAYTEENLSIVSEDSSTFITIGHEVERRHNLICLFWLFPLLFQFQMCNFRLHRRCEKKLAYHIEMLNCELRLSLTLPIHCLVFRKTDGKQFQADELMCVQQESSIRCHSLLQSLFYTLTDKLLVLVVQSDLTHMLCRISNQARNLKSPREL